MSEPFIGEIMLVGFNYAPRYWAMCQGQTLPINQNQALFSLLGTTFGGNGVTTFQLPDMRARIPVHVGTGGGTTVQLGEVGGQPSVTLNYTQLPQHTHAVAATDSNGSGATPVNAWLATMAGPSGGTALVNGYVAGTVDPTTLTSLLPASVTTTGGNAAHDNRQPVLGVNFIIALSGIYPSRP